MKQFKFFKSRTVLLSMLVLILLGFSSNAYAKGDPANGNVKVKKVKDASGNPIHSASVYLTATNIVSIDFWTSNPGKHKIDSVLLLNHYKTVKLEHEGDQQAKGEDDAKYKKDGVDVSAFTPSLQGTTNYQFYVVIFDSNPVTENSKFYVSSTLTKETGEGVLPKLPKLDFEIGNITSWYNVTPLPEPTFTFDKVGVGEGNWFDGTKPFTISGTVTNKDVVDSVTFGGQGNKATLKDTTDNTIWKWSYTYQYKDQATKTSAVVKAFGQNQLLSHTIYEYGVDNTAPTITGVTFNNAYKKPQVDSFFFKKGAADAQVKATVTDALSGVATITFDEKPYTSATFVDLATATAGENVAIFHAVDSVGHVKDTCITYFVDGTAPVLTVGDYLKKWTVKSFKIGVNAKDNTAEFESGLDSIAYAIAGAEPVKYTDSITIEENTVVKFKAVDKVGNADSTTVTITNILLPSILVNTATDKVGDKYTHCTGDLSAIDSTDTFYVVNNVTPKEDSVAIKLGQTVLYKDHFYKLTKENTTDLVLQVVAGEVITVNVGAVGYATVYSSHNLIVPKGVTAAAYAHVGGNNEFQQSTVFTAGEVLPGGFGYVVIASPGSYDFVVTTQAPKEVEADFNCLKGSDTEIETPSGEVYVLDRHNGVVGFYPYNKTQHQTVSAHKAYYRVSEN